MYCIGFTVLNIVVAAAPADSLGHRDSLQCTTACTCLVSRLGTQSTVTSQKLSELGGLLFCRRSSTKYLYVVPVQGGKGRPTWHGLGWPALAGPTRNKLLFGPAQYYFTKDQATWLLFCELATMPLIISCITSIQLFHNYQGYLIL